MPPRPILPDAFARSFLRRAGPAGVLSFADFMDLALYDPAVGYYAAARDRVGRRAGTDFYTASTMREVFGGLVAAAAAHLLAPADPASFRFVEIGAEPGAGVLQGVAHPFAGADVLRLGDAREIPPRTILFSNELLDAQPFNRVQVRDGRWVEMGVVLREDGLEWAPLANVTPAVAAAAHRLPGGMPEGHTIDLPLRAAELLRSLVEPAWRGLFLAFDYGRTWDQLATEFPAGTGRGYHRHRHARSLLERPGEQDLTCHVCWDWLEAALRDNGFDPVRRRGQEAFFVAHAPGAIRAILEGDSDPLSARRTRLKHLLHPALMGQRFEALWARR